MNEPPRPEDAPPEESPDDPFEAGLRLAFGPDSESLAGGLSSVLEVLGSSVGEAPRINLKDVHGEHSPIVRPLRREGGEKLGGLAGRY